MQSTSGQNTKRVHRRGRGSALKRREATRQRLNEITCSRVEQVYARLKNGENINPSTEIASILDDIESRSHRSKFNLLHSIVEVKPSRLLAEPNINIDPCFDFLRPWEDSVLRAIPAGFVVDDDEDARLLDLAFPSSPTKETPCAPSRSEETIPQLRCDRLVQTDEPTETPINIHSRVMSSTCKAIPVKVSEPAADEDFKLNPFNLVVYAPPGSGKTALQRDLQKQGKLVFDTDCELGPFPEHSVVFTNRHELLGQTLLSIAIVPSLSKFCERVKSKCGSDSPWATKLGFESMWKSTRKKRVLTFLSDDYLPEIVTIQ